MPEKPEAERPRVNPEGAAEVGAHLVAELDAAYEAALAGFSDAVEPEWGLSSRFADALQAMSDASNQASTAFTNIVTCLAIKSAYPKVDIRYHQVQIKAPFNFRGPSEKYVYPWLRAKEFEGAKSGWQTRTFERPRPYTLDFPENIGAIKQPFLICFDEIEEHGQNPRAALGFLFYRQLLLRDKKQIALAAPNIDDISSIVTFFESHFSQKYTSKGASRLPVLAIYSIYQAMMSQVKRYERKNLRKLQNHAAADAQTGAIGDIEIEDDEARLFEGVEIKHDIRITEDHVEDVARKVASSAPRRYYILTTYGDCQPSHELGKLLAEKRRRIGTQIIVNGVVPTIRYYLRLLENPSAVFPFYVKLLAEDVAISHEHRAAWNDIVSGKIT